MDIVKHNIYAKNKQLEQIFRELVVKYLYVYIYMSRNW